MSNEFVLRPGLCCQLESAFERNGYTVAEVNELTKGNTLGEFLKVLRGNAEIKAVEHLIDCDSPPVIPSGYDWTVEEHRKGGQFRWDQSKVSLYLSKQQKGDQYIGGDNLRKELKGKKVLNANVLDYLLKHQYLIPEEWKGKAIFFWGTIYRRAGGGLNVRYLNWDGAGWRWYCGWLGSVWDEGSPAALLQD